MLILLYFISYRQLSQFRSWTCEILKIQFFSKLILFLFGVVCQKDSTFLRSIQRCCDSENDSFYNMKFPWKEFTFVIIFGKVYIDKNTIEQDALATSVLSPHALRISGDTSVKDIDRNVCFTHQYPVWVPLSFQCNTIFKGVHCSN